jgi:hypothetical protein
MSNVPPLDHFRGVRLDADQPLNLLHDDTIYYDYDHWFGEAASEPYYASYATTAVSNTGSESPDSPDDIENIYTGLHRCVDEVVATISIRAPPRLDQIKEQNRRVMDKLKTLESAAISSDNMDAQYDLVPAASKARAPAVDRDRPRTSRDKRRRVSVTKARAGSSAKANLTLRPMHASNGVALLGADIGDIGLTTTTSTGTSSSLTPLSHTHTPYETYATQTAPDATNSPRTQSHGTGSSSSSGPLFSGLGGDSKLARKLQQIGAREASAQVAEFAAQLRAPEYHNMQDHALPTIGQFSSLSSRTTADAAHFRQLVLGLGMAIESSIFGEQNSRIRKRIALAHFYHAYALAQEYPDLFLSWCDDQQVGQQQQQQQQQQKGGRGSGTSGITTTNMLPKGGSRSVVQHRFANLIFPPESDGQGQGGMSDAKRKTLKIQMWRKSGKKWAQIIERFGYGILLLLPSSLSDEE